VNNANNWLRNGAASLPQNGDDVVATGNTTPMLWNLSSLASVQFNSWTRWQDGPSQVGLPSINPNGYIEYRSSYFQFTGPPAGTLTLLLGQGTVGSGTTLERYNVGGQLTNLIMIAAGSASDTYNVRFLGTNQYNTFTVLGGSLAVAMLAGETSALQSGTVDGGGSISLGPGCTYSGQLTLNGASAALFTNPSTLLLQQGSTAVIEGRGLTYGTITAVNGSTIVWSSNSTIMNLTLEESSSLDCSANLQPFLIVNSTLDGDTCQIVDPNNTATFSTATTVKKQVTSGPFAFQGTRKVQVS
jgi:hypothetical protein